ncbi:MAG: NAD-dependent epimerase/dehydratase family protein [Myxococcota bacterium]
MRHVLVTHLDSIVGRRLVKALFHDPEVSIVLGTGTGPRPSFLDAYQAKCAYQQLDLAKARHLTSLFHSERFARARIDSVIHLPFVNEEGSGRIPGNVPSLVSETRRLLEACKKHRSIERFVYLSSAFVYRPEPGNVNIFDEEHLLGFETEGDVQVRAWIDADLICQGELNDPQLKMTILRTATILTETGEFLQSPPLARGEAPLGFDPMLSVVADRDVARALVLALHSDRPGIYNIAGGEVFPCSELRRGPRRIGPLPVPGVLSAAFSVVDQAIGLSRRRESGLQRYGVVLDTRLARESLGFEPLYRIELRGRGSARRVDTIRFR